MRHERVKITRDGNTVHNRTVAAWEIPILEYLFDPGNVEPTGDYVPGVKFKMRDKESGEVTILDYPPAEYEFQRLVDAYKADPKSGIPHAVSVFGNGRRGITELRKLIDSAKKDDDEALKSLKPAAAKKVRRPAYEPVSDESLLS